MGTGAPITDGRFRHIGDKHPMAFCDFFEQHSQEHQPVGHGEDISVVKVQFELGVRPFTDHVVKVPAQCLDDIDHLTQETHRID